MAEPATNNGFNACSNAKAALSKLKGIVKVAPLNEDDKAKILELEKQAEDNVMMGICKGINLGLVQALQKKNVFACITDDTMVWPKESYIKLVCGDEVIGQDVYDMDKLKELKEKGDIVAGNLVFYRGKMKIFKERRNEARVLLLPMQIPELVACTAVVASPSPPTDLYVKQRLEQDVQDPKLGSIIVGVD